MRILLVGLDPIIGGGVPSYTRSLIEELTARDHELVFFHSKNRVDVDRTEPFCEIKNRSKYKEIFLVNSPSNFNNFDDMNRDCRNLYAEKLMHKIIIGEKPDIVHFQHVIGLSGSLIKVAKSYNLPVIFTIHDYWLLCPRVRLQTSAGSLCSGPYNGDDCATCLRSEVGKVAGDMSRQRSDCLKKIVSENVDTIIAVSKFVKNIFTSNGYPEEKIKVINSTNRNIEKIWKNGKIRSVGKNKPLVIGCISNIYPPKGLEVLVEAIALLSEIEKQQIAVKIYGEVHDHAYYKNITSKVELARLPITFYGKYREEKLPDILNDFDIGVVPSVSYESFGLTSLELLAARIPVLGSSIGGIVEIIIDGVNGFTFKPADSKDLQEKISMFIEDKRLVEKLSKNIVKPLTIKEHAIHLERLYCNFANRKPRTKKASIVILTHNKLSITKKCLRSVKKYLNGHQIIVVDNASNDGTLDYLRSFEDSKEIILIANKNNMGFAAACNQGVALAKNSFILLLNNDAELFPECLENMIAAWNDDVGAVGAKLFFPDGKIQHAGVIFDEKMSPYHRFYKMDPMEVMDFEEPADIGSVTAACLLTTKERWNEIGGLDESFKLGCYEDIDFCLKLRQLGYRIVYQPKAKLVHHEHASSSDPSGKHKYWQHNLDLFLSRWQKKSGELMHCGPQTSIVFVPSGKKDVDDKTLKCITKRTSCTYETFIVSGNSYDNFQQSYSVERNKIIQADSVIGGINEALKKATGRYISIIYGGMLVQQGWMPEALKLFENKKIGIAAILEEGMNFQEVSDDGLTFEADYNWEQSRSILIIPRDLVVERIGLFSTQFDVIEFEDIEYQLRLLYGGLFTAFLKDLRYKKIYNFSRKIDRPTMLSTIQKIWKEYERSSRAYFQL